MKKIFTTFVLTALILLLTVNIYAQHPLSLSWEGEPIGDTLIVNGDVSEFEILAHAVLTNNTTETMDIKVRRMELDLVDGSMNLFCWALCYGPTTDTSSLFLTLGPNESSGDEDFSGHYSPNGINGTSMIDYKFYNMADPSVSTQFVVIYSTEAVGIQNKLDASMAKVFPNPTTGVLNIQAEKMKNISLFDVTGKMVWNLAIQNPNAHQQVVVDCSAYHRGIYFAKIETLNGTLTKKVMVE